MNQSNKPGGKEARGRRHRQPSLGWFVLLLGLMVGCQRLVPNRSSNVAISTPTIAMVGASATPHTTPTSSSTPTAQGIADAQVTFVRAVLADDGRWTFHVTVAHPDTGWEDYADGWDIVLPNGDVVKPDADTPFTRLLLHPHVTEQPFTRSQSGIIIPTGVTEVEVRAHDLKDGFGGHTVRVDLQSDSGPDFVVER